MGYQTGVRRYYLDELGIPTTVNGQSPFRAAGTVAREPGYQRMSSVAATDATIYQNNDHPWTFGTVLHAEMVVRIPNPAAAGDELFIGLATTQSVIASLDSAIGFHLDGSSEIKPAIVDTTAITEEASGISLGSSWKKFVIDLYSGVQSVSAPGVSKGGLGSIQFSVENDNGQLVPVGGSTLFDMSAFAATGCQLLWQVETSNASFVVHAKYAEVSYRDLP